MKVRETTEEKEYLIEENKRYVTSASRLVYIRYSVEVDKKVMGTRRQDS